MIEIVYRLWAMAFNLLLHFISSILCLHAHIYMIPIQYYIYFVWSSIVNTNIYCLLTSLLWMCSFLSRQIDILFVYFANYGLCVHSNLFCGMKDDIWNINSIYRMLLKMPCFYHCYSLLLLTERWKFNTIETHSKISLGDLII